MNLLILSTWFPYPPDNGSRLRAYHLIRELTRLHTVRLVAGRQDDVPADVGPESCGGLELLCERIVEAPWHWFRGEGSGGWRSLLSGTPRSIVETENAPLRALIVQELREPTDAVLVLELGIVPMLPEPHPPAVLDQVEVSGPERLWRISGGAVRLRNGLTLWKFNRYWSREMRRFAAITAVSEEEAESVRRVIGADDVPPPVVVAPNGVDAQYYRTSRDKVAPGRMIYNGAITYGPNLDAMRWFAEETLPRIAARVPDAHLVVTGRYDGAPIDDLRANERVRFTGFVDDIRPELDQSAVCVVPLRSGGGTRLKILEAFAASLPVVSTRIGAAGLDARDGEHLVIADDPLEQADALAALLREPQRAEDMAGRARKMVAERYDWTLIAANLSFLLENVVHQKVSNRLRGKL